MDQSYAQRWYLANRDKIRRQQREWYLAHRDEILRRRKERYAADPQAVLAAQRRWQEQSPKQYQQARITRTRNKKLRALALFGGKCQDCGESFPGRPEVFDFDHRDPSTKTAKPANLMRMKWDFFIKEITAKCDLVCANCHRTRTVRRAAEREFLAGKSPV